MCEKETGCKKPDKLEGDPAKCSPEQIRECHGEEKDHACVKKDEGGASE
ncbi:hypothetical protein ACFL34_01475 [Candidatus Sumerlaeota bacterium]